MPSISITNLTVTPPSSFSVTAYHADANTSLSPTVTFDVNGTPFGGTTSVGVSGITTKTGTIPAGSSFTVNAKLNESGSPVATDSTTVSVDVTAPVITNFVYNGSDSNFYNNVYYVPTNPALTFNVSVDGTGSPPKEYEMTTSPSPTANPKTQIAAGNISGNSATFPATLLATVTDAVETWYLHVFDAFNNYVTKQFDVYIISTPPAGTVTADLATTTPSLWENPPASTEYYANTTSLSTKIDVTITSPLGNLFTGSDPTLHWIVTTGGSLPTTKTAPNGTQFIGTDTAVHSGGGTISITPSFTLVANTWNSIDIYARDLAYNVVLLGSVEVYSDLAGPVITTGAFTPATTGYLLSNNAPVTMSYPYTIDLENIVYINQYIPPATVIDEHSGLATVKMDVGDPLYNTYDDYTASYPQTSRTVGGTTVPIQLWPFQFTPIDHATFPDWTHANTTSSGTPEATITDQFSQAITFEEGEFGIFIDLSFYLETNSDPAILTDATNDGYGKTATFELEYTPSTGTPEVQFARNVNDVPFMAFPRVDGTTNEGIIIYRGGTSDTGGTLTATMKLEGRSSAAYAKGMYDIKFIGKVKAIPGTGYPITITANDYFNNITTDTSMSIPIVKKPTISEFGFSDYFQPFNLDTNVFYTQGEISFFAEFKSGIPVDEIILYMPMGTTVDATTGIGQYVGRIERNNLSLPTTGAFIGAIQIKDEDGNTDVKACSFLNVIPADFNPIITASLSSSVNVDGSGNILDPYITLDIVISQPGHAYPTIMPIKHYKITNDSTILSPTAMTAAPSPPSIGTPFTSLQYSVPTAAQPNTFKVRIHVMDVCGNLKYQDFSFTSDSLALTPSGKIKSTALVRYKDSFDPTVYQLLTVNDPRRVEPQTTSKIDGSGNVKDAGLTDNGRLLQLNKGNAIWSSYLGERQASDPNYVPEVRSTGPGTVTTTQEARYYSNRFPGTNKYLDSEYVGYQNNEAEAGTAEDIGDVLRVENDSFVLDDTIEDNKTDNNVGTLTLTDQG